MTLLSAAFAEAAAFILDTIKPAGNCFNKTLLEYGMHAGLEWQYQ